MINHYTANRKVRNDDAYSPGGRIGRRPDRATLAYCQRAREAYKGVPVIAGGVEASLRRLAHYDYWSDKVRRSIMLDAKADLLVFGMGERALLQIVAAAGRRAAGATSSAIIRGVAYRLGASDTPPAENSLTLPSFEEVSQDKRAFAAMTRIAHLETNPHNARRLVQYHGREVVVVNPPALPLTEEEMDRVYGLPYTRRPHPAYGEQKSRLSRWSRTRSRSCGAASAAARSARSRPTKAGSSRAAARSRCWPKSADCSEDPEFRGT